jgi:hypothetical protein
MVNMDSLKKAKLFVKVVWSYSSIAIHRSKTAIF